MPLDMHISVGLGIGVTFTFQRFMTNYFLYDGKVLSGELSCSWTGLVSLSYDQTISVTIVACDHHSTFSHDSFQNQISNY